MDESAGRKIGKGDEQQGDEQQSEATSKETVSDLVESEQGSDGEKKDSAGPSPDGALDEGSEVQDAGPM